MDFGFGWKNYGKRRECENKRKPPLFQETASLGFEALPPIYQ
jgi:hypothetical protein